MEKLTGAFGITMGTVGLFAAIIVCLAVPPKVSQKIIGKLAGITAVSALILYGYGFTYQTKEDLDLVASVLWATFDVLRVFVGSNDWGTVSSAFQEPYQQVIFWVVHLMGLFTSASAVITALGSGLVRKIRLKLLRMWDITLIYGLNDKTLAFGRELMARKVPTVLYVDANPDKGLPTAVDHMGGILRSDVDALNASVRFLKSIGLRPGKRKIRVFALSPDMASNQKYANRLRQSMEQLGLGPEQSTLTILGPGDETDNRFQNAPKHYGYGSVISIHEPEMVARILVKNYPPCHTVSFDERGRALNDFHGVIIGFGQIGQAVLQQLVMNGQFAGNHFKLAVFSPDYQQRMGRLAHECDSMLKHYDITFYPHDGRSCQMYDYIAKHSEDLNYIAVCAGSHGVNLEIAEQLQSFLKHRNCGASIYMCSRRGVAHQASDDQLILHEIYTPDILCTDQIDKMAMVLNQSYTGQGDMRENWKNCGYFNRMSSRSAADFYQAILCASGKSAEDVKKQWEPEGALLENLSIMEHLRWNAFHYSMGFRPMTDAEFEERCAIYREEKKHKEDTNYRITRDMDKRIHACMISWEELDAYSKKENAVTGGMKDYQENDRNNIRALAEVLRAMEKAK